MSDFGSNASPRGDDSTSTTRLPAALILRSESSKPSSTHSAPGSSGLSSRRSGSPALYRSGREAKPTQEAPITTVSTSGRSARRIPSSTKRSQLPLLLRSTPGTGAHPPSVLNITVCTGLARSASTFSMRGQ